VLGSFQNIRQSSDQNARLMPVAREAHNRRFLTRAKLAARIEVDGGYGLILAIGRRTILSAAIL
jgi:hypothetical protein